MLISVNLFQKNTSESHPMFTVTTDDVNQYANPRDSESSKDGPGPYDLTSGFKPLMRKFNNH